MTTEEIQELLASADDALLVGAGMNPAHKRMLVIIPDGTRTAPIPLFFRLLYEQLGCRAAQLDYLIALGTHQPLDTFVPRDGESMVAVSPLVIRLLLRRQTQADGWRIDSRGTYGVTTEPDRSWVLRSVTPHPLKTLEQPLHLKNPSVVSTKPRTHIDCTGGFFFSLMQRLVAHLLAPRALPPAEAGWRLRQLPTGHDAMITMPRELADLLLEVV